MTYVIYVALTHVLSIRMICAVYYIWTSLLMDPLPTLYPLAQDYTSPPIAGADANTTSCGEAVARCTECWGTTGAGAIVGTNGKPIQVSE